MSATHANAEPLAANQATVLLRQVTLSQAACLAREGSYSAAEELLSGLLAAGTPDVSTLDLLARIRAQQGALLDAASLWRKVQQIDPNHLGAAAGLERLRAAHRKPLWLQPALALLVGLAVIACGVLAFDWQARRQRTENTEFQQQLTELAKSEASAGRQQMQCMLAQIEAMNASQTAQYNVATQNLSNQVAALHADIDGERVLIAAIEQRPAPAEKPQQDYQPPENNHIELPKQSVFVASPPNIVINDPGVSTSALGDEFIVRFDNGLFDYGTHFKIGAEARLLAVAKALSQSTAPLQIKVVGFADDDRAFFKWTAQWESALALKRASTVVDQFIALGLFQSNKLLATAGNSQERPFASDSLKSRLKNRTVVLWVSVDKQNH